jgi:CBS domain containing-hemolysin-like protein
VAAGEPRTDILVSDVMIPRRDVKALSYGELETATVGDIVESLRCSGQQHCLVVDDDEHSIRGLIAASDVAERLHRRISVKPEPSFADIFSALRH